MAELAVLAIVIALHAVLAALIYWEVKNERKEEESDKPKANDEDG